MEMHKLNDFEDFSFCSTPSGVFSDQKSSDIKCCFYKHKIKICVAFLLFAMILVIIYFLKSMSPPKAQKVITKRSVNDLKEDFRTFKVNIELIPENQRILNHKFSEKELEQNSVTLLRRLNAKEGWSSNLFESKINKNFDETQEMFSKVVQKPEEQRKLTDLGSSMRLKGIYLKSEQVPENQLDEKYLNSKEINNLMLNYFIEGKERKKLPPRSLKFQRQGSPFKLQSKGLEVLTRKKITQENLHINQILKKQPITMFLELHPMGDFQNFKMKFKPNLNAFKHSKDKIYTSKNSYSFNTEKIILPQDNRNRMILKLNLYPKESNFPNHRFGKQRRIFGSKYNSKPERKSFGWFYKQKKNNLKNVSLWEYTPLENRITPKQRNEQGERIHADHDVVKNLEKKLN